LLARLVPGADPPDQPPRPAAVQGGRQEGPLSPPPRVPEAGRRRIAAGVAGSANVRTRQDAGSEVNAYSMISVACCRIDGGMSSPRARAVLRLITKSKTMGCSTG